MCPDTQTDGNKCSGGATADPQPHRQADGIGESVELVHPHGRMRLHHTEDGECTLLQGLALVLHLTEAALQVRHLMADGLQLLLQHNR